MDFIIDNWYIAAALLAVGIFIGAMIVRFCLLPRKEQETKIIEFLKNAVLEAEKRLGSKTGQAKLSLVYGMFVDKMPWIARVITFSQFSAYVDVALEWLKIQMESNPAINNVINE